MGVLRWNHYNEGIFYEKLSKNSCYSPTFAFVMQNAADPDGKDSW